MVGAIIFFKFVNSNARRKMLEDLFTEIHKEKFLNYLTGIPKTPYRKGLLNLISEIDTTRNEIVHWHVENNIEFTESGEQVGSLRLNKPNFWERSDANVLTDSVLQEFVEKANFVSLSVGFLSSYLNAVRFNQEGEVQWDSWRPVFEKPCVFPPDSDHPFLKYNSSFRP